MSVDPSAPGSDAKSGPALPNRALLRHVVDVHCHPTDSPIPEAAMDSLSLRICAMATRKSDQKLVADLAEAYPDKVTPCFGYHPWFSHLIALERPSDTPEAKEAHYKSMLLPEDGSSDSNAANLEAFAQILPALPHPYSLSDILDDLRSNLEHFLSLHSANPRRPKPMLGEVGLDRAFRIPFAAYDPSSTSPPSPDQPRLSPFSVPIDHQLAVLRAQLSLAVELGVSVSLHSVKSPQHTLALLSEMQRLHGAAFARIGVDMHSCGVSVPTWRDVERRFPNVYLSLSTGINLRSPAHRALIAACAEKRILVESDWHAIEECEPRTWAMILRVAEVKGWAVEEDVWDEEGNGGVLADDGQRDGWGAVRRLEANWRAFISGDHSRKLSKKGRAR